MTHSKPYESDFEEYLRHIDAGKKEKKLAWSTAIGLQQVDGLKPSAYLYETAKRNIEGELSFEEAKNLLQSQNSWYFRNALVRANYNNLQKGIHENPIYLERFFQNLLFGGHNELKNRYTHIDYDEYVKNLPVNDKNLPVNKIQAKLLKLLQENPSYTYNELAEKLLRTRETVRANLRILEKLGLIKRIGADKNGHWEIVEK